MPRRTHRPGLNERPVLHKVHARYTIDWTHPLAQGLVLCLAFVERGGSVYDLVKPRLVGTLSGGANWYYDGLNLPAASSSFVDFVEPDDSKYLGSLSLFCRAKINTGGAFREFAIKATGTGGLNNPFEFRTAIDGTTLHFIRASSANASDWAGPLATLGVLQNYGVTAVGTSVTTAPTFYINGVPTTGTGGVGSGTVSGSGADILVGRRGDGGVQMDGSIELFFAWNRVLSTLEMQQLSNYPYAFLQPTTPRSRIFSLLPLSARQNVSVEWVAGVTEKLPVPVEWRGVNPVTGALSVPVEWLAKVQRSPVPVEWAGVGPGQLIIEWNDRRKLSAALSVQWLIVSTLLLKQLPVTWKDKNVMPKLALRWQIHQPALVNAVTGTSLAVANPLVTVQNPDIQLPTATTTITP